MAKETNNTIRNTLEAKTTSGPETVHPQIGVSLSDFNDSGTLANFDQLSPNPKSNSLNHKSLDRLHNTKSTESINTRGSDLSVATIG